MNKVQPHCTVTNRLCHALGNIPAPTESRVGCNKTTILYRAASKLNSGHHSYIITMYLSLLSPNFRYDSLFFPLQATKDTEKIYLGPHGAPPSRAKKQEDTAAAATGYRDKSKVKEADQKVLGTGRDNKGGNNFNRYNNAGHHVKEPYKRST